MQPGKARITPVTVGVSEQVLFKSALGLPQFGVVKSYPDKKPYLD